MLSTVVLSNENQTCRDWEAPTSTGGGGCHVRKLIFDEDEMVELDTAQLDFNSGTEDYYLDLTHFCEEAIKMIGISSGEKYWILQMI